MAEKSLAVNSGFRVSRAVKSSKNQRAARHPKELTKPMENGTTLDEVCLRSAKHMRRRAHKIARAFFRHQLKSVQDFWDDVVEALDSLSEPPRNESDKLYELGCKSGSVHVTADRLYFQ